MDPSSTAGPVERKPIQPLSLEDQCLLQLICHLEEYDPETLASLPLHLRRRLLLNLPAVDICQLEDTAVAEGINMELDVWKRLGGKSGSTRYFSEPSSKDRYFDDVFHYLYLGAVHIASRILFSVRDCLGVSDWRYYQHSFNQVPSLFFLSTCPSRHVQSFTKEKVPTTQLLSDIVHKCHCRPDVVSIDCSEFVRTDLWKRRHVGLSALLSQHFGRAKTLSLSAFADIDGEEPFRVPRFILELVFSQPMDSVVLRSLALYGNPDFVSRAVAGVLPFLSAHCVKDRQSVCPQTGPYRGLTTITVRGSRKGKLRTEQERVMFEQLRAIVLCQSALESFALVCLPTSSHTLSLFAALGQLFHQPQFRSLRLQGVDVNWESLRVLVSGFLASPVSQEQELLLCLVSLTLDGLPPLGDVSVEECTGVPGKVLHFRHITFDDTRNFVPLCRWLAQHRCPELLGSFEFSCSRLPLILADMFIPDTVMALIAGQHQAAQLRSFTIDSISLRLEPSPAVPFVHLFSAPHLQRVALWRCRIGRDGLLPALTEGLLKQVPHGVLEELSLGHNELGDSNTEDFCCFASAIFNLPQLINLELGLQWNGLQSYHFAILHDTWKMKANHVRMKLLSVCGNEYENLALELHEIAASGDYLDETEHFGEY